MRTRSKSKKTNRPRVQVSQTHLESLDLEDQDRNNTPRVQNRFNQEQAHPIITMADDRTMAQRL